MVFHFEEGFCMGVKRGVSLSGRILYGCKTWCFTLRKDFVWVQNVVFQYEEGFCMGAKRGVSL